MLVHTSVARRLVSAAVDRLVEGAGSETAATYRGVHGQSRMHVVVPWQWLAQQCRCMAGLAIHGKAASMCTLKAALRLTGRYSARAAAHRKRLAGRYVSEVPARIKCRLDGLSNPGGVEVRMHVRSALDLAQPAGTSLMTGGGPLAGLRVVELSGIGPAPHAAMVLADLGADVIRVERPDGRSLKSRRSRSTDAESYGVAGRSRLTSSPRLGSRSSWTSRRTLM